MNMLSGNYRDAEVKIGLAESLFVRTGSAALAMAQ
jgi:hypothetical protein